MTDHCNLLQNPNKYENMAIQSLGTKPTINQIQISLKFLAILITLVIMVRAWGILNQNRYF